MTLVQRGNVVLEVKDDAVQRMLDMGYDVIDEWGNIIKPHEPKSISEYQALVKRQEQRIAELEAQLEKAKSKKSSKKSK